MILLRVRYNKCILKGDPHFACREYLLNSLQYLCRYYKCGISIYILVPFPGALSIL